MSKPYNPNTQGWGFALVVCAITAGLFYSAYNIHSNTYRHPRDPMATQVYSERDSAKAAGGAADHSEAAGAQDEH